MKNKKILIIPLCAVLIALGAAASVMLKRNSISKHSLIYADVNDNKLISYKISEKAEIRISFDGYSEYLLVGKYIGGEYCCVSKGENSLYDVLLIKNGNIEKTYQLSFCPDEIAATDDGIYCLTNGKIYRLSTADNTETLYKDNVYTHKYRLNMLITDKGDLVYLREENDGSGILNVPKPICELLYSFHLLNTFDLTDTKVEQINDDVQGCARIIDSSDGFNYGSFLFFNGKSIVYLNIEYSDSLSLDKDYVTEQCVRYLENTQ